MVARFSNTEQNAASIPELAPMLARAGLASIGRCHVAVTKSTDDRSLLRLCCVFLTGQGIDGGRPPNTSWSC